MLLFIVVYIISFIDCINIGMVKVIMLVDIGFFVIVFGFGVGLFFFIYVVLEIFSNLFFIWIGVWCWIVCIMIIWGIFFCGMVFVIGFMFFYVMCFLFGVVEVGFYLGIIYYFIFWFGCEECVKVIGLFLLGVCLVNIIGVLLGGLLLSFDGMFGWYGW